MNITTVSSLQSINAADWDRLTDSNNIFIQHDFLRALEQHDCLQPWGWYPNYIVAYDGNQLTGACPCYVKTNSYGEFVFDWAWAEAYQRNGLPYYPKLVTSVPYTPATGPRLLSRDAETKRRLIAAARQLADKENLSGIHWLFCEADDIAALKDEKCLLRHDYQFHWHNQGYRSFDDFLKQLNSKKRKNIVRERRKVREAGIELELIPGTELTDEQWQQLYGFYEITFAKKSGAATLSLAFFQAMAHKLIAVLARHSGRTVAGAICFQSHDTLYGRHWGCHQDYDSLHFEVCYYAGIEHCIAEGLKRFEPGAQGEHKIWRGFLPVKTQSAHWISHQGFRSAIADFLDREQQAMAMHGRLLQASSPYKKTG